MLKVENGSIAITSNSVTPSNQLISRIKTSYKAALSKAAPASDSPIWTGIAGLQSDIHNALLSENDADLTTLLSDPQSTNLYYGVDGLAKDVMVNFTPKYYAAHSIHLKEQLNRLVIALGGAVMPNPESVTPASRSESIEECIAYIDNHFAGLLEFPNPFAGEAGIFSSKGVISYRAIQAIYQALLAKRNSKTSCLEIGGGMGRTAYYGSLLGLRYTIIDLPMTIVGQALFLSSALGDDSIWLLGDEAPRGDRIALLPPTELSNTGRVDTVLNVDSLTEMGHATATQYLEWARLNSSKCVSINHESNEFTVNSIAAAIAPFSLNYRCPYWLRDGYVEEVFTFSRKSFGSRAVRKIRSALRGKA